jgi:rubredoxin
LAALRTAKKILPQLRPGPSLQASEKTPSPTPGGQEVTRCHNGIVSHGGGITMTDERPENGGEQGESVPLNWACTNCGYRVEGELPEKCPDCGADREMFEEVPIPGY